VTAATAEATSTSTRPNVPARPRAGIVAGRDMP
jgi:hypothetical protein